MKAVPVEGDLKKHAVYTPYGSRGSACEVHATKRAIFSTVTSFGMMVELDENGTGGLSTVREGKFELSPLSEEEKKEKDEKISAQPTEREGQPVLSSSLDPQEDQGAGSVEEEKEEEKMVGAQSKVGKEAHDLLPSSQDHKEDQGVGAVDSDEPSGKKEDSQASKRQRTGNGASDSEKSSS
jgi:hypothetical protein